MPERIIHVALTESQCQALGVLFNYVVFGVGVDPHFKRQLDAITKAIQAGKFRVN